MGEPDESGRSRPEPVAGAVVDVPVDVVIVAVGNAPNPMLRGTPGLEVTNRGTIVADPETGQTERERVFAGGDIVTGGATVILAMGAGRRAAAAIDDYLQGSSLSGAAAGSH
jgi:glutamate synthase (NADPH) small chain